MKTSAPRRDPGLRLSRLILDVTTRCNLNCLMCGVPSRREPQYDMDPRLYDKIAEQAFPRAGSVWLSCGYEALMSRHIMQVLDGLRLAADSTLITNGTLLTEIIAKKMINVRLSRIYVSFDGASPAVFEAIRRGASMQAVRENIAQLNALKTAAGSILPDVRFTTTLMRSNIHETPGIIRAAAELGASAICLKPLQRGGDHLSAEYLESDTSRAREAYAQARETARELGIALEESPDLERIVSPSQINAAPPFSSLAENSGPMEFVCGDSLPVMRIWPDGKVEPCTMWRAGPAGDFTIQCFDEIISSDTFQSVQGRRPAETLRPECRVCPYARFSRAAAQQQDAAR